MSFIACYIFLNNGENKMAFDKVKFKKKMRTNGFTQKNIAEVLNVDIRTVSRWLDPKICLSSEKIATLCDVIGEAPSDFDSKLGRKFQQYKSSKSLSKNIKCIKEWLLVDAKIIQRLRKGYIRNCTNHVRTFSRCDGGKT